MKDLEGAMLTERDFESSFQGEPPPPDPRADLSRGQIMRRRRMIAMTGVPAAVAAAAVSVILLNPMPAPLAGVPADGSKQPSLPAQPAPEESQRPDRPASPTPASTPCGQALAVHLKRGAFQVTADFPQVTRSDQEATLFGTVAVSAGKQRIRGVTSPTPDVFLVRRGQIVSLPLPKDLVGMPLDLAPGKLAKMPATASLTQCDSRSAGSGGLSPGNYQVYARLLVHLDSGSTAESWSRPSPLRVR
jgi:hypothetical protein